MHIHLADPYHHGHSRLHRMDPRLKVILTFLFILTVSLTPMGRFGAYSALLALVLAAATWAGLGPLYVLRRSVVALPFALAAVTLPFTMPGQPLVTLPFWGGILISDTGTIRFLSIVVKSAISVQMAVLLVAVTPFPDILWALRSLRLPALLIAIVSFMYRYLFVLSDEALRLLRARSARSATPPAGHNTQSASRQRSGGSLWWRGKIAGHMVGSLLLRSLARSERIYQAMAARGYQGQIRMLSAATLRIQDILFCLPVVALLVAILFLPW